MATVTDHYATHLAPVYIWMVGGVEQALAAGAGDLRGLTGEPGFAVDLGAGFGMHSIPLAKSGFRVLAIDSSPHLLAELKALANGLDVETACADLLSFPERLPLGVEPTLMLCMGDTLTHLADVEAVRHLAGTVAANLSSGGRFIATFRDYSRLPGGTDRFIPVRSDRDRILTCFLEERPSHVDVHDILHEWREGRWVTTVSSYPKLRLSPEAARTMFAAAGLRVNLGPGPRGMLQLVAEKSV